MGVDSVLSQTSEEVKEYRVKDELSSVFNYGIGVEWKLRGNLSAYGSVARDASAAPEDTYEPFGFGDKISNTYLQADGVHIGSGITIEATWIDFTFGFSYGTTSQVVQNPLTGSNPVLEVPYQAAQLELQERRWRFLIGFTVPFVEGV